MRPSIWIVLLACAVAVVLVFGFRSALRHERTAARAVAPVARHDTGQDDAPPAARSVGSAAAQAAPRGRSKPRVQGSVNDGAGRPISGATVCWWQRGECASGLSVQSNAAGRFELWLDAGDDENDAVELAAWRRGYRLSIQAYGGHSWGRVDPVRATIVLEAGASVSGEVLDATGGPLAGAWVRATEPGALQPTAVATTDPTGHFELDVGADEVELSAALDGYTSPRRSVHAPAADVRLVAVPSSSISGVLVARDGGAPVSDLAVTAQPLSALWTPALRTRSAADGSFHFPGVTAGSYELVATAEGWASAATRLDVALGENLAGVELEVDARTTLTARISVAGAPCQQGTLELTGVEPSSAATSPAGVARIDVSSPGEYEATARCRNGLPKRQTLRVARDPLSLSFDLRTAASVRGSVLGATGSPVGAALVRVSPRPDAPQRDGEPAASGAECRTDERGDFVCEGLTAGSFECGVWLGGRLAAEAVRCTAGEAVAAERVVLRVQPSGTIRARAAATPGGLGWLTMLAKSEGQLLEGVASGEDYVFEGVSPGTYQVYAGASAEPPSNARSVRVAAGEVVRVVIEPPPELAISGTVVDTSGEPVVDVWVRSTPNEYGTGEGTDPVLTDADGAFTLRRLLPGLYDIAASGGGSRAMAERIAAGTTRVRLVVSSGR